jgi:hypothetical protein
MNLKQRLTYVAQLHEPELGHEHIVATCREALAEIEKLEAGPDEGEVWSFIRAVLARGGAISQDFRDRPYEAYSVHLDGTASKLLQSCPFTFKRGPRMRRFRVVAVGAAMESVFETEIHSEDVLLAEGFANALASGQKSFAKACVYPNEVNAVSWTLECIGEGL